MAAISSGSRKPTDTSNLGPANPNLNPVIDPSQLGFNLKDLSPETFDKIKAIIDSANSLMTEEEKKYQAEQKKKQIDAQKRFDEAIEIETRKEVFEIPKESGKTYKFVGYDSEQFIELMNLGNKADNIKRENPEDFDEYNKMSIEVFKKTIKYSLEGMTDEVLNKLPKRLLHWYYLVMKDKNENPLPFVVNA